MMRVVLDPALQQNIFRQLEASYPNEGGGFLLGAFDGEGARITDVIPVANVFAAEEQYHRYLMTPQDWARLEDEADARGLLLLGYYHSHPDSPAIPSAFDRENALPFFIYLITQVQDRRAVEMLAWRLRPDRSQFDAEELVIGA